MLIEPNENLRAYLANAEDEQVEKIDTDVEGEDEEEGAADEPAAEEQA
jgi:hypothetical protein